MGPGRASGRPARPVAAAGARAPAGRFGPSGRSRRGSSRRSSTLRRVAGAGFAAAPPPPAAGPLLVMAGRGGSGRRCRDARRWGRAPGAPWPRWGGASGCSLNDGAAAPGGAGALLPRPGGALVPRRGALSRRRRGRGGLAALPPSAGLGGGRGRVMEAACSPSTTLHHDRRSRSSPPRRSRSRGTGLRGGRFAMRDGRVRLSGGSRTCPACACRAGWTTCCTWAAPGMRRGAHADRGTAGWSGTLGAAGAWRAAR